MSMSEIREKVDNLINDFRTKDPFVLAKKSKIKLLYRDLGDIKGFYRKIDNIKFIALNENLSELLTKFVLCHELGHAFLHDDDFILDLKLSFIGTSSKIEFEANYFAAYLLKDDEVIYYPNDSYEEKIVRELKNLLYTV